MQIRDADIELIEQIAEYLVTKSHAGVAHDKGPFPQGRAYYAIHKALNRLVTREEISVEQKSMVREMLKRNFGLFFAKWSLFSARKGMKKVAIRLVKVRLPKFLTFHMHSI